MVISRLSDWRWLVFFACYLRDRPPLDRWARSSVRARRHRRHMDEQVRACSPARTVTISVSYGRPSGGATPLVAACLPAIAGLKLALAPLLGGPARSGRRCGGADLPSRRDGSSRSPSPPVSRGVAISRPSDCAPSTRACSSPCDRPSAAARHSARSGALANTKRRAAAPPAARRVAAIASRWLYSPGRRHRRVRWLRARQARRLTTCAIPLLASLPPICCSPHTQPARSRRSVDGWLSADGLRGRACRPARLLSPARCRSASAAAGPLLLPPPSLILAAVLARLEVSRRPRILWLRNVRDARPIYCRFHTEW